MESYEEILSAGGKTNSLGRAAEVIEDVYKNPKKLNELFVCISADNPWVRMRASDSFEKIIKEKPEWVQPYLDAIFSSLTKSSQPSVQWHLAQIFMEVELAPEQQRLALRWLMDKIKTIDVDWIVAVNVMKALLYFHSKDQVSIGELQPLFETQKVHSSKTVRKKAAEFLGRISG